MFMQSTNSGITRGETQLKEANWPCRWPTCRGASRGSVWLSWWAPLYCRQATQH